MLYQPIAESPTNALAPTGRLRQFGRWLVLLIPLMAAAVLSPSALSSTTLANRGLNSTSGVTPMPTWSSTNQQNVKAALEADPNQPVPVEVTDLIALSRSPQQMASFDGRTVRVVGFLTRSGGEARLVRGMMWCCAADVQPVSVELAGNTAGTWKDTEWLEIVGQARFPSTLGRVIPQVEVQTITPTQEPDEPYLSP